MTAWYRARFLFCSFGPLYLLLFVGLVVQHKWAGASLWSKYTLLMALAGGSFIISLFVFQSLRNSFLSASPSRCKVVPIESLDESVLGYMLSYIPPLMIDDLNLLAKVAPAIVFYVVLILILLRTDTMYVNPYFLLFKYRIYRVQLPSKRAVVIITKKAEILQDETISLYEIQPAKLYFAK